MMQTTANKTHFFWMLTLAAMALLLSACSKDANPLSAPGDAAAETQAVQYPPFDPATLWDGPEPGVKFLETGFHASLDVNPCDTMRAERWCRDDRDNTIKIDHLVEIRIPRGALDDDETVSIVAPQGCWAVADFYPHPYQFNGNVQIKWYVKDLGLPRDFDYDSLIPYYVTDDGEYERMPSHWRHGHDELVVITNHFSRYILGRAVATGE